MKLNKTYIKIKDSEHSKQVQEVLFKHNINWPFSGGDKVQIWGMKYIFIDNNTISWDSSLKSHSYQYKEITLEDILGTREIQYEIY
jgi:hypothetical protein